MSQENQTVNAVVPHGTYDSELVPHVQAWLRQRAIDPTKAPGTWSANERMQRVTLFILSGNWHIEGDRWVNEDEKLVEEFDRATRSAPRPSAAAYLGTTTAAKVEELLACPFCGEPAEMDTKQGYRALNNGRIGNRVAIYCTRCNADMGICEEDAPDCDPDALSEMIREMWNRRHTPPAPAPQPQGDAKGVIVPRKEERELDLQWLDMNKVQYIDLKLSKDLARRYIAALKHVEGERDALLKLIEKAVTTSEDHDGGTVYLVAYGEYDENNNFIPPVELPNIPSLEKERDALREENARLKARNEYLEGHWNQELER